MKRTCLFICLLAFLANLSAQTTQERYQAYIKKYAPIAQEQMRLHKIPASITLAQGLLESGAGMSDLATKANNHFGIKCAGSWQGETFTKDDDQKDECFRKYKKAEESYEDHSKFLLRPRYESLFALAITDYKSWARGLKSCGYATDPGYAGKLIKIIEDYNLTQYDVLEEKGHKTQEKGHKTQEKGHKTKETGVENRETSPTETSTTETSTTNREKTSSIKADKDLPVVEVNPQRDIKRQNWKRYIVARQGDTFVSLAYEFNIDEKLLRTYNDILNPEYELQAGDRVYLQRKRKRAEKKYATYFVRKGENIWQIAQDKGMQLSTIYKLNGLEIGCDVTVNQELKLR